MIPRARRRVTNVDRAGCADTALARDRSGAGCVSRRG
jgi:hypothetical protein